MVGLGLVVLGLVHSRICHSRIGPFQDWSVLVMVHSRIGPFQDWSFQDWSFQDWLFQDWSILFMVDLGQVVLGLVHSIYGLSRIGCCRIGPGTRLTYILSKTSRAGILLTIIMVMNQDTCLGLFEGKIFSIKSFFQISVDNYWNGETRR